MDIRISLCEITTRVIAIGLQGENDHARVVFDASGILGEYPDATAALTVKPPQGNIYPKAVEKSGNNVYWVISSSDCAYPGNGEYQLTFTNGEQIIKSFIGNLRIFPSLIANGTAPDPVSDWMQEAQAALGELEYLSASAESLPAGSQATAEVTQVGGHKNILIGVPAGQQGDPGQDGFSPVISVTDITGGHRVTITSAEGSQTIDVMDGTDGQDGEDGFSPTVTVTDITGGHRISITDATGTNTFDVLNGTNGTDGQDGYSPTVTVTDITGGHRVSVTDATGTKTFDVMDGTSGGVSDVQVNGTSVVSQGVANVPVATVDIQGVAKIPAASGLQMINGGLYTKKPESTRIKNPTAYAEATYQPIVPIIQHESVFYGLANASGDTSQASSNNSVGTYTEDAKSGISQMLNAPEIVSGSTPSITAKAGVRYICGEVSTLSITAPASGCIDVVFQSGSTPTVLAVSSAKSGVSAIEWSDGFDETSLSANATYWLKIIDGEYGVATAWGVQSGGGGEGSWHKLVNAVANEEVFKWKISSGDKGEVFNDYKKLFIVLLVAPNTAGKTSRISLGVSNSDTGQDTAYSSPTIFEFAQGVETGNSILAYTILEKAPFGIIQNETIRSANAGSVNQQMIYASGVGGRSFITNLVANTDNANLSLDDVFDKNFTSVIFQGYENVIGIGTKCQVWGYK